MEGGLASFVTLDASDYFGSSVASVGDYNEDGVPDLAVGASMDDDGSIYGRPSESFSGKAPWHTVNAPGMQQTDPRAIGVPGAKPGHAASAASREDDCPQDEEACPGKS